MSKIYYLYSEREVETIYISDDGDGVEKPKYKTGIYPIGSILSTVVKVLTPWIQSNFSYDLEGRLSEGFQNVPPLSSFASLTSNDKMLDNALYILIINREKGHSGRDVQKLIPALKTYINYIDVCQNKRELATVDKLIYLCSQNSNTLPQYSIFTDSFRQNEYFSQDEIKTIFTNSEVSGKRFTPDLKKGNQKLFKLPPISIGKQPWGELATPIRIFEIYDIVDLILSSLQCIFEKKYIINRCAYCGNLFVSMRKLKYCPPMLIEDKDSCRAKLKQIKEQASESSKYHKSIRNMLHARIGTATGEEREIRDKELETFLKKTRIIREERKMSEDDYIAWMDQYWRNVKEEAKKRKKAKSSK